MKKILQFIYLITALLLFQLVNAQEAITYQVPPKDLTELLLAKPTPSVSIDSKGEWMLLMDRNSYPSVEEMAQPELRIFLLVVKTSLIILL
jgi:hypothetical protein